jgi:hypothetical protein
MGGTVHEQAKTDRNLLPSHKCITMQCSGKHQEVTLDPGDGFMSARRSSCTCGMHAQHALRSIGLVVAGRPVGTLKLAEAHIE